MVDSTTEREEVGAEPTRRGRIAVILGIAVIVALILTAGAILTARFVSGGDTWAVESGIPVEVTIAPGTTANAIYALLDDARVARANELRDAASTLAVEDGLRAGTYALVTDMDPEAVIRQLVAGPNVESGDTLTVVEGWTLDRIITELAARTGYTQAEFQSVLRGGTLTSPLLPPVEGPVDSLHRWEGLLYPATYPIIDTATPDAILGMMADEMTRRVDGIDWSRLDALGVSRYEAVIIASLIEREAGTDGERATIASVIYNRLAASMRLQIDATVIYALGYNPGRVTADHLAVDSPWNTYRNDGLPPTPIGAPSISSLRAAANPAATSYLFYVLGGPDGSHLFAETYEEHQANIEAARRAGTLP
jgi:UPF0755 protein